MRDALNQVKEELGGDAVIMSNKKVAEGIEIVAAYDKEPVKKAGERQANPPAGAKVAPLQGRQQSAAGQPKRAQTTPSLSEIIGDSGPDSLRALLEKQNKQAQSTSQPAPAHQPKAVQQTSASQAAAPAQHDDKAMDDIRLELQSLRNVLEFQVSGLLKQERQQSRPLHSYLIDQLQRLGITTSLAEQVVSYAPPNCEQRDAWKFLLKLLMNRLHTSNNAVLTQGGVVALVGPTGTGKTTTIAKLAAQYARKHGHQQVALITTDSYRIAAYEQLATYGKIIGCTVKKASSAEELSDQLYQFRNKGLVLIDTAGFGQRDARLIKQLDTLRQSSCANIKHYLVLAANAQHQVMEHTLNTYRQISLQGCIFTKLDECYSLGEAISLAVEHKLPVGYLTDGQKVPEDIKVADGKYLISCAARLYKQYASVPTRTQQVANSAVSL